MSRATLHDDESEQSVLGAVLLQPGIMDDLSTVLTAADFGREAFGLIFAAMAELHADRQPIDYVTVCDALKRANAFERAGGLARLVGLDAMVPSSGNWRRYAETVRDLSLRRSMIEACMVAVDNARNLERRFVDVLGDTEQSFAAVATRQGVASIPSFSESLGEEFVALEKLWERGDDITGVPTGVDEFDRLTAGYQKSDLITIAGVPGSGKTAFAINSALHAAMQPSASPVVVFSQEMSRSSLLRRILSGEARIDGQKFRNGKFADSDFARIAHAMERIHRAPLFVHDVSGMTVHEMRGICRRIASKHGALGEVVVDYIQIMQPSDPRARANENDRITEYARGLKRIAREFCCPVVALSQLTKEIEKRPDKRPTLNDLLGSGSIRAESDLVVLLYRDELYNKDTEDNGVAEIEIAKHRAGPLARVRARFDAQYTLFGNLENRGGF